MELLNTKNPHFYFDNNPTNKRPQMKLLNARNDDPIAYFFFSNNHEEFQIKNTISKYTRKF